MKRGGGGGFPRGNMEKELFFSRGGISSRGEEERLDFQDTFRRGGFFLMEVYPQGRKGERFYEERLLWIYFEGTPLLGRGIGGWTEGS